MAIEVYLVYTLSDEGPSVICTDEFVAYDIANILTEETSKIHWVTTQETCDTLDQFSKGPF